MYRRLTKGLNDIGTLIPENADIYKYIENKNSDYYLSIYKYTEDQKKTAEEIIEAEKLDKNGETVKYKRPRGVVKVDNVVTNLLAFDLDSKTDLNLAKKDTIAICERLHSMGIPYEEQNIAFSGGKGFSITLVHDKNLTPDEHRYLAENIAGDLKTFDTTIYNASRIFRINNTKHNTTGLYKTPLDFDTLKDAPVDWIKDSAKKEYPAEAMLETKLTSKFLNIKPKEKPKAEIIEVPSLNFKSKPFFFTDVKFALHSGYIPEGYGNTGMLILCSTYKHLGYSREDAYFALKAVNEKRASIYGIDKRPKDEIWQQVVSVVYNPGWMGGTFGKENALIKLTMDTFGISEGSRLETFDNIVNDFFDFAENINENIVKTGIKSLDESLLITTGMMVGILGSPSSGKTALITSIVENHAKSGMKPLFCSLDMTKHLLSMRLLQRESGVSTESKLRRKMKEDALYDPSYNFRDDEDIKNSVESLSKIYKNVNFNFTRGATIESIEEDIKANKIKHGEKFKLVVVDYLEKVRGPYSDSTANSGFVASRLSDLASTYDVTIMLLLQPQKSAGDPSEPLLSMRKVKGASVIEQDCRVILTLWREGFNPQSFEKDKFASVAIVKNNMGEVRTLDYAWDGLKGQLNELKIREREQLASLREAKAEAKAEEKASGWGM